MRTVVAPRYVTPLREGGSMPGRALGLQVPELVYVNLDPRFAALVAI